MSKELTNPTLCSSYGILVYIAGNYSTPTKLKRSYDSRATATHNVVAEENKERKKNNVVEEFKIGNTRIKICDDYCYNRSDKDIEEILARIARKSQEHFTVAVEQ